MKLIIFTFSIFVIRTSSFTPVQIASSNPIHASSSSKSRESVQALNLVPSQGCQLAAASAAALAKLEEEKDESNSHKRDNDSTTASNSNLRPSDATREFVSRLFHLPFVSGKPSEEVADLKIPGIHHESDTATTTGGTNDHHNDVVLYPIVGFQYVKLQDGSTRGIPTINASPEKATCNFSAMNMSKQQPLHGWFSECCMLGDLFANDDEYCGKACSLKLEEK